MRAPHAAILHTAHARDLLQPSQLLPDASALPVSYCHTTEPCQSVRCKALRQVLRKCSADLHAAHHQMTAPLVTSKEGCLSVLRVAPYSLRRRSPVLLGFPGLRRPVGVDLAPIGSDSQTIAGTLLFRSVETRPRRYWCAGSGQWGSGAPWLLCDQATGFYLILGHDIPTIQPLDDPHTSGTRFEHGLSTFCCLCEEDSNNADLPSHRDTGMSLHTSSPSRLSWQVWKLQDECSVGIADSPLAVSCLISRLHTLYAPLLPHAVCGGECWSAASVRVGCCFAHRQSS